MKFVKFMLSVSAVLSLQLHAVVGSTARLDSALLRQARVRTLLPSDGAAGDMGGAAFASEHSAPDHEVR